MKKLILPAFLAAGLVGFAGNASAHGLYFSLGYNFGNPKLESTKGTCYSGYQYCYPGFSEYMPSVLDILDGGGSNPIRGDGTFGNGGWPNVNYDGFGYWFDYGGVETWDFKPSGGLSLSAAIGWEFPLSPLRMEIEYTHTSFKVKKFGLQIFSPGSVTLDDAGYAALEFYSINNNFTSDYQFKDSFEVDFASDEQLSVTTSTIMLNSFLRIPLGVEGITPYVGMGIGTFSMSVSGGWVQPHWSQEYFYAGESGAVGTCPSDSSCSGMTDGPWNSEGYLVLDSDVGVPGAPANMITGISNRLAYQLMAGVEYRFPKTPYIVGLEYRWLKVDNAEDKGNNDQNLGRQYVWDNWYNTYEQSQISLKFRYDFISNDY